MSEVKKIATRDSYGNALAELGTEHDNVVVLDADLAAATKTGVFKKAHPDRFIDCGIAESNMIGVAAGLATTGKVPFASSFAMFAAGRAFEQVRNSVKNTENLNFKNTENVKVSDIGIRIKHKSVSINADVESIIRLATTQNFVPVVDDEGIFIGIIKRSDIINYCYNAIKKEKKFL